MWQVVDEASIAEENGARLRLSELYYALAACKKLQRGRYALRGYSAGSLEPRKGAEIDFLYG